jgi:hypothetical protein
MNVNCLEVSVYSIYQQRESAVKDRDAPIPAGIASAVTCERTREHQDSDLLISKPVS